LAGAVSGVVVAANAPIENAETIKVAISLFIQIPLRF
jgi:hypothetical protein